MVCGESEDGSKAIPAITAAKPDLVVAALNLRRSTGIALIKNLNAIDPKLRILVLSIHEESLYAQRCLRAGARGYLMKEEATEKVLLAIRRILAGQVYLSEAMQSKLFRTSGKQSANVVTSPLERLSDRELDIFRLLGGGGNPEDFRTVAPEHQHGGKPPGENQREIGSKKLYRVAPACRQVGGNRELGLIRYSGQFGKTRGIARRSQDTRKILNLPYRRDF